MKKVDKDGMPREVATEMLCAPGVRMTNKDRKMFQRARQIEWVGEVQRKPIAEKLANRMRGKSIAWLGREAKRMEKRRRGVQLKYEKLVGLEKNPVIERLIAVCNLQAGQLDMVIDALLTETQSRCKR